MKKLFIGLFTSSLILTNINVAHAENPETEYEFRTVTNEASRALSPQATVDISRLTYKPIKPNKKIGEIFIKHGPNNNKNKSGTVFAINANTFITNKHVITHDYKALNKKNFTIKTGYSNKKYYQQFKVKSYKIIPGYDIAVLKTTTKTKYFYKFSSKKPKQYQAVYGYGYPFTGTGQDLYRSKGYIVGEYNNFMINQQITRSGMSGGPITDIKGNLVGMHAFSSNIRGTKPMTGWAGKELSGGYELTSKKMQNLIKKYK